MSLLGKRIELTGLSQKGKNRVRELGPIWHVLAETDRVLFSPDKNGPWLFISPEGKDMHHKSSRWIHGNTDPDFAFKLL